jgi:glycosyltransferase involved in cell wall biosynthesis
MAYQILDLDLDLDRPLGGVSLADGVDGIAVLLRRRHRPVGFFMEAIARAGRLDAARLGALVAKHAGTRLLRAAVDDELREEPPAWRPPAVSVVICTRDRPALVRRCLASLCAIRDADADARLEIVVVDNAPSDDGTRAEVARLPGVRYFREPKPGLNFARNRAVAEAAGDVIAFIDDDAVADRGWLEGLFEALRENPDAAAVTGLVLPFELETPAQILFEQRGGFRRGFEKLRYDARSQAVNRLFPCGAGVFGAGCNMAFKLPELRALGGFDDALDTGPPLPGGGDLDIFYRVLRAGHPLVYEPRFLVFHQHRRELKELRRQYWSWGLGFMAFLDKSYRTDPALRPRIRAMTRWWFADQLWQLGLWARRKHVLPANMIAAELLGGAVALTGTYSRSRRRANLIMLRHT